MIEVGSFHSHLDELGEIKVELSSRAPHLVKLTYISKPGQPWYRRSLADLTHSGDKDEIYAAEMCRQIIDEYRREGELAHMYADGKLGSLEREEEENEG